MSVFHLTRSFIEYQTNSSMKKKKNNLHQQQKQIK